MGIVGVCVTSDVSIGVGAGVAPGIRPWIHPTLIAPAKISVRKMNALFFIWVSVGEANILFFTNVPYNPSLFFSSSMDERLKKFRH